MTRPTRTWTTRNLGSSNHLENGRAALGLSDETDRLFRGPSGELLDAFVFGKFDMGAVPVNVKLGRHTVFWGESHAQRPVHSLSYGQSALDLGKLFSAPGTEAKELFLPREAISMQVQATPNSPSPAQYFFDWEQARIPEAGSFLGFNDSPAARRRVLHLRRAAVTRDPTRWASTAWCAARQRSGQSTGDWGLSARWSPEWLDGTLGAYYRVTADILPQGNATPAVRPNTAAACARALGRPAARRPPATSTRRGDRAGDCAAAPSVATPRPTPTTSRSTA